MSVNTELVYYYPSGHEGHKMMGHPERPQRVEVIRSALSSIGLWDQFPKLAPIDIPKLVIDMVHDPTWLSELATICRETNYFDINTYVTPVSLLLALNSAGGSSAVATSVWRGEAKRGFSLNRPPGHHATRRSGGGYCLLNNVSLAAETLLQLEGAKRLAIIDFDLHHGNGTQDIFWSRGDVLFISTHQMPLFPGSGYLHETGDGIGTGLTVNLPLPPGAGDRAYRTLLDEIIIPLLNRFRPEMLLISFGFDAHWRDPYGSLLLSASAYGRLIELLTKWADDYCQGRIILVLEGGYDLMAASACGCAAVSSLLGLSYKDDVGPAPYREEMGWRKMVEQAKILFLL